MKEDVMRATIVAVAMVAMAGCSIHPFEPIQSCTVRIEGHSIGVEFLWQRPGDCAVAEARLILARAVAAEKGVMTEEEYARSTDGSVVWLIGDDDVECNGRDSKGCYYMEPIGQMVVTDDYISLMHEQLHQFEDRILDDHTIFGDIHKRWKDESTRFWDAEIAYHTRAYYASTNSDVE